MRGGFVRLPPLPHPHLLIQSGHYPGPCPGSAKCDLAPLIVGGGCEVLPTKPGWYSLEGSPPNGASPAQPLRLPWEWEKGSDPSHHLYIPLRVGGASGLVPAPLSRPPHPPCSGAGTQSPVPLCPPADLPTHGLELTLAQFCNLDHEADFSKKESPHTGPRPHPAGGLHLPHVGGNGPG